MNDQPTCGQCGGVLTPETASIHPEYFLHDTCLPPELSGSAPLRENDLLTTDEEAKLRNMGKRYARAMNSPWEPRCIAHAFATRRGEFIDFTMQVWIDLDAAESPLLNGQLPETYEDFAHAQVAFGFPDAEAMLPDEASVLADDMLRVVKEAFALSLPMKQPEASGASEPDGFGAWLPMLACLITQCHLTMQAALSCNVGHAYALISAMRRNQGWKTAGKPYALRQLAGETAGE